LIFFSDHILAVFYLAWLHENLSVLSFIPLYSMLI
jgi:hypothetical protein